MGSASFFNQSTFSLPIWASYNSKPVPKQFGTGLHIENGYLQLLIILNRRAQNLGYRMFKI